jgi:hypothetical protein
MFIIVNRFHISLKPDIVEWITSDKHTSLLRKRKEAGVFFTVSHVHTSLTQHILEWITRDKHTSLLQKHL